MKIPVPWVYLLAYLLGVGIQLLVPVSLPNSSAVVYLHLGGIVLLAGGAVIAGWSLVIFRRVHTTTVPGAAPRELVTWGPYRFSRNPMYVGLLLAYIGEEAILAEAWPLLFLVLTLAYLNWKLVPVEEARLREKFDGRYEEYCRTVRRWI